MLDRLIALVVLVAGLAAVVSALVEVTARLLHLRHLWLRVSLRPVLSAVGAAVGPALASPAVNPTHAWCPDSVAAAGLEAHLKQVQPGPAGEAACATLAARWPAFERASTVGYQRLVLVVGLLWGFALARVLSIDAFGLVAHLEAQPAAAADIAAAAAGDGLSEPPASRYARALVQRLPACAASAADGAGCVARVGALVRAGGAAAAAGDWSGLAAGLRAPPVPGGPEAAPGDAAALDAETRAHGAAAAEALALDAWARGAPVGFGAGWAHPEPLPRLLGQLLLALVLAGGAPVWFDLLRRLIDLRAGRPSAG